MERAHQVAEKEENTEQRSEKESCRDTRTETQRGKATVKNIVLGRQSETFRVQRIDVRLQIQGPKRLRNK